MATEDPITASSVAGRGGTVGESQYEWKVGRDLGGSPLSHKEPGSQTGFRDAEIFLQFTLPGCSSSAGRLAVGMAGLPQGVTLQNQVPLRLRLACK